METTTQPQLYIGIDIGGTLAKVCMWCPKGLKIDLPHIENLQVTLDKGKLLFNKYKVTELPDFFKSLKELKAESKFKHLYATGGGAFKYIEDLKEIDAEYKNDSEINSLFKGFNFITHVRDYAFYYTSLTGHIYINQKPTYPLLLVNIGSGVSAVQFTNENEYTRLSGTTLGGGTFLGLSNMIIGTNNFDELIELAKNGSSEKVDLLIRDIYHGQDSPHSTLSSQNLAVSLGKLAIDHMRNIKKVKKEDMARSLLIMVAFNISQLAYYFAKTENIKQVYFAGNFIRQCVDTMECISHALSYFSAHDGEKINAIFLKHDGFLGALGVALDATQKEHLDILTEITD